jgi:hypothetical protein
MSDINADAPAPARIAHRSSGRMRLRVPGRRRDLSFFLELYDALRREPEIDEVTLNPASGGVLLWFDPQQGDERIMDALNRSGLIRLIDPDDLHPEQRARHRFHTDVNDTRIVVFLIMTTLSLIQLRKGQLLAPALTMLLYVIDLAIGMRAEQAAAHGHDAETDTGPTPSTPTSG